MVKKFQEFRSDRYLLAYFIESKIWKMYLTDVVDNHAHWVEEDPKRAEIMYAASLTGYKGYTIEELLYDMIECIYKSNLKESTKQRLYNDIDFAEKYHELNGTLKERL